MWKCHKCAKPVFFAERKQSLGYDWHPECLRCEECGKRLNPGQHAEHKGIPYCHVPCYGALFGPQLFGHGTRVESHKSFGHKEFIKPVNTPSVPRGHLETKLKAFNQYYDGKSGAIRSREVNGRLVLEGPLRIHWGVRGVIHLKEDDDQRMRVITVKKRSSCRYSNGGFSDSSNPDDEPNETKDIGKYEASEDQTVSTAKSSTDQAKVEIENLDKSELQTSQSVDSGIQSEMTSSIPTPPVSPAESKISATLPSKLDNKQMEWDELDELLQVERRIDESGKLYQTMPTSLPSQASVDSNNSDGHINSNIEVLNNNPPQVDTAMEVRPEESDGNVLDSADNTIKNPKMYTNTLSTEQYDELTLKPNTDLDIVNLLGKNELMPLDQDVLNRSSSDDTLKANSPIDPRKINDSLKLYGDLVRSASHDKVLAFGRCNLQHDCFEESLTMKPMRRVIIAHNRTLSVDSSVDRSGEELNNQSRNEYPLQRSVSGPESLKAADYEDSASDSETINYAHPVDDHIIVPGKGEVLVRCGKHNRTGSTAIRRRNGKRRQKAAVLRRRCSINGHFYDRETSFFTPPHGSLMSVWVTSLVSTSEVINLILDKYKVDAHAQRFALFIVRDNGEQRRLKDEEYPLITRVTLGPREDISKLFLMDADKTGEVSPEVAQFINLSSFECEAILRMYTAEENRELDRIRDRFFELRRRIKQRMEDLRVRL